LLDEIKARGWPTGESIGTEAELLQKFKVSRATLVEATRQIESQGAATMRRGSNGGLFVLGSNTATAARVIAQYLELADVSIAEQYETARIVETEAVRLAAISCSEESSARLREEARELSQAIEHVEFHAKAMRLRFSISEVGGNSALTLFLRALARVITSYVRPDLRGKLRDRRFEHLVASDMIAIVEAVTAGDHALGDNYTRQDLERREARARILAVAHADLSGGAFSRPTPTKLAEQVALSLRQDILTGGLRTGDRVAHEPQLPGRYTVSQWTMRQGIRILELHGIIETRRGQGGGLFVGQPSPEYAIATVVGLVGESGFDQKGAREFRRRLFESIAQFAAVRGTASQHAALEAAESAGEHGDEAVLDCMIAMAHNRVLSLFAQILMRYLRQSGDEAYLHERKPVLQAAARSILGRDGALARRQIGAYFGAAA